jgi:hypothetical protein
MAAGGPYEGAAPMVRASYALTPWTRVHLAGRIADGFSAGLEVGVPSKR